MWQGLDMLPPAGGLLRSQKLSYSQAHQDEDDPFLFDEQRLHYDGYDNRLATRPTPWHTPHYLPLSNVPSEHQTHPYTLPVPPASMYSRLADDETPVKEYRGYMPRPTKFDSSSRIQVPIPRLQRHRLQGQSQQSFGDTVSSFFGDDTILPDQSRNFINTSGMPILGGINLVSVHELPDQLRPLFQYPVFNRMQSKCFKTAYGCDDNLVVSAPTASGKTTIFELAICRLITRMDVTNIKMVYIGPTRALCEERSKDWGQRFQHLGVTCSLLTGDSDNGQQQIIKRSQLIITTPEKWDSITRSWHDKDKLMHLVHLLLIDEVHMLNEERGASLEAVVTRMKSTGKPVRLVALSATVPNATDVAAWLGRNSQDRSLPAHLEVFGTEFRPCKLQKIVHPIKHEDNQFKLGNTLNRELPAIIRKYGVGKAIMVFCPTRKSAKSAAISLAKTWTEASIKPWPAPQEISRVEEEDLKGMLSSGVAYHHAGLTKEDRETIQQAYLNGNLMVICCTSTLSVGINLPCHLVIIKDTRKWTGESVEYNDLEILQMLGRAGRPQFGDHGIGVIMTTSDKVAKYESLVEGKDLLESSLHLNLIEHLNAEITLGTIHSIEHAKTWLASTFLYVRLQKNREHYFPDGLSQGTSLDQQLENLCVTNISELRKHDMVEKTAYRATKFGELMTKQYIRFKPMVKIMGMDNGASMEDILATLCSFEELRDVKLDSGKADLLAVIKTDCKNNHDCTESKRSGGKPTEVKHTGEAMTILHYALSRLKLPPNPKKEFPIKKYRYTVSVAISKLAPLVSSVIECRRILNDGISVGNALALSRSLAAQAWDDSPLVLTQLRNIGDKRVENLKKLGIKTFDDLMDTPPEDLDRCGNSSLFGTKLLSAAKEVPSLRITVSVMRKELGHGSPRVHCRVDLGFINKITPKMFNKEKVSLHLLTVRSDGHLVVHKHIQAIERQPELTHFFSIDLKDPGQRIICQVACDRIAGTKKEVVIDPNIPAREFAACKKSEPLCPPIEPATITQLMPLALNEDIEFNDDSLNAEDFLAAESEGFQPASNLHAVFKDNVTKPSNNPIAEWKTHCPMSKNATCITRNPDVLMTAQSGDTSAAKGPCKHLCKDKSSCKHPCCQDGRKNTRTKKNTGLKEQPGNTKGKAKRSIDKVGKASKQEPHTFQAKIPLSKVTKVSSQSKQSASVLDKIHKSARDRTRPVALLTRTPVTMDKQNTVQHAMIVPSPEAPSGLGEDWFDDTVGDDDGDAQPQMTEDAMSHYNPGPSKVQDDKHQRKPKQWIPDILTDSELDDYEPYNPIIKASSKSLGKRKAGPKVHGLSKKICIGDYANDNGDFGTFPPLPLSTVSDGWNGSKVPSGYLAEATIAATDVGDDSVVHMSQELASYHPFSDNPAIDPDFIARYVDCCEFVE